MKIKWLGQSGYVLSDEDTTLYLDPYLSDCVNRVAGRERMVPAPVLPAEIKADAFICSHNHLDHLDVDLIGEMDTDGIDFYAPTDCKDALAELGVKSFNAFDCGTSIKLGKFELEAVYADHTVPAVGVVVTYDGKRLYFTGDTFYNEKLENISCDVLFVCINGKLGNMDVNEAVKLTEKIKPVTGIPNHYGMFESNTENPENYTKQISNGFIMEFNKEYSLCELLERKES